MKKWLSALMVLVLMATCIGTTALAEGEPTKISLYMEASVEFDPETNPIVPALEEACNVDIEFILPPQQSYAEQLNLMMASGEYPDVVFFTGINSPAFQDGVKNGVILALDEYVDKYPNFQQYIDPVSFTAMRSAVDDGKLYGLPRNSVMRVDGWLVRDDWLKKVGIELEDCSAVTPEEFYNILYKFTKEDPDGNGVDDTYGLATGSVNLLFSGAFGDLGWQKAPEGSEYEYMSPKYDKNSTAFVDALAFTNKLWAEGLIDPNDITNTGNAFRDRFYNGNVGVVRMFGGWLNTYEPALHEQFPGVETKYIVGIKNAEGECIGTSNLNGNVYGAVAVMAHAEEKVDAILGLLDYMLSDEGWELICDGVEGWTYEIVDGKKVATEEFTNFQVYRNYLSLLRRYNDPGYFVLLNNEMYERSWAYIQAACDACIATMDMGFKPDAATTNDYMDFQTEVDVAYQNILLGKQAPETWLDVLNEWYEWGGQDYVEQMNEYIASLQ